MAEIRHTTRPETVVYLNGNRIVEYYGHRDTRNISECEVTESYTDDPLGKSILRHDGNEYTLDAMKCESIMGDIENGASDEGWRVTHRLISK